MSTLNSSINSNQTGSNIQTNVANSTPAPGSIEQAEQNVKAAQHVADVYLEREGQDSRNYQNALSVLNSWQARLEMLQAKLTRTNPCNQPTSHDKLNTGDIPTHPQTADISSEEAQGITRRQLLGLFTKAALAAPLTAIAAPATIGSVGEFFSNHLPTRTADILPVAQRPPYPDPTRTATIDHWRDHLDRVIVSLESLWTFLGEARALDPAQVDGPKLIDLNHAALDQVDSFTDVLNTTQWSDLVLSVTGQREWHLCIKNAILHKEGSRRAWLAELEAISQDYPPSAIAELRDLLDTHFPAVL